MAENEEYDMYVITLPDGSTIMCSAEEGELLISAYTAGGMEIIQDVDVIIHNKENN